MPTDHHAKSSSIVKPMRPRGRFSAAIVLSIVATACAAGVQQSDTEETLPEPEVLEATAQCAIENPSTPYALTVYLDEDGDGYGTGVPVDVCVADPDELPDGMAADGSDCDDSSATVFQVRTAYPDADGDGATSAVSTEVCSGALLPHGYLESATVPDCNDDDPAVFKLQTFYGDGDGDGYGALEKAEFFCAASPPPGYALDGSDPDDSDKAITPLDEDGDGVADANDCAATDAQAWRFAVIHEDADGDKYTVGSSTACIGTAAPHGFRFNSWGRDCDDSDASLREVLVAYGDSDKDGFGTGSASTLCAASLPEGFAANDRDCDDANASFGEPLALFVDNDGDGVGAGSATLMCVQSIPSGFSASPDDCNDADSSAHQLIPGYRDNDGDGYGHGPKTNFCALEPFPGFVGNRYDNDDNDASVGLVEVTAAIHQPSSLDICEGDYCAGTVNVVLTAPGYTALTLSSYEPAIWCVYARNKTTVVSVETLGYHLNTVYPTRHCGLENQPLFCKPMIVVGGVNYRRQQLGSAECVAEPSEPNGSYIADYDANAPNTLVK